MDRYGLTDAQWVKGGAALPREEVGPRPQRRGQSPVRRSGAVDRTNGQSPARPAPLFGRWNTVFKCYRGDWAAADIFKRLFDAASDDPDRECAIADATIVKVHRHGQGAERRRAKLSPARSGSVGFNPVSQKPQAVQSARKADWKKLAGRAVTI